MASPYTKPHMPVADQIALLQKRGLEITDIAKAESSLARIGYYRLSEYWHPMRTPAAQVAGQPPSMLHTFQAGARFSDAADLYVFDKRLRLLMLDAIERVEVALRVWCAHTLGAKDPYIHRDWKALAPEFVARDHATWLSRIDSAAAKSREDFIANFLKEYAPPVPLWVSIECWDFGVLSYFVGGLRTPDQTAMSNHYGLPRRELLTSWVRSINHVRNISAHHSRLWNRVLVDRPKPPRAGEIVELDHLAGQQAAHNRLYSVAAALQYLLKQIHPTSTWSARLQAHMQTFPASPLLNLKASGFPQHWEREALWAAPHAASVR